MTQVRTQLYLPEEQREWLKEQPGPMAETVREAVDFYREYGKVADSFRKLGPRTLLAARDELKARTEGSAEEMLKMVASDEMPSEKDLDMERSLLLLQLLILTALQSESEST